MADEGVVSRICAEDDPDRCIAIGSKGQCSFKALPGISYCIMHGRGAEAAQKKRQVNQYHLTTHQARLDQFKESPDIKGLRDEIGIARILLETLVNRCHDSDQMLLYSNKIKDMLMTLEKLIVSCNKLEITNNQLLDRETVAKIVQIMITVISKHVTDPDILEVLSTELISGITNVINGETSLPVEPEVKRLNKLPANTFADGFDEEECDNS